MTGMPATSLDGFNATPGKSLPPMTDPLANIAHGGDSFEGRDGTGQPLKIERVPRQSIQQLWTFLLNGREVSFEEANAAVQRIVGPVTTTWLVD
jgi:hypothetical protein